VFRTETEKQKLKFTPFLNTAAAAAGGGSSSN